VFPLQQRNQFGLIHARGSLSLIFGAGLVLATMRLSSHAFKVTPWLIAATLARFNASLGISIWSCGTIAMVFPIQASSQVPNHIGEIWYGTGAAEVLPLRGSR